MPPGMPSGGFFCARLLLAWFGAGRMTRPADLYYEVWCNAFAVRTGLSRDWCLGSDGSAGLEELRWFASGQVRRVDRALIFLVVFSQQMHIDRINLTCTFTHGRAYVYSKGIKKPEIQIEHGGKEVAY